MTRPLDIEERNALALDLLHASFSGRTLPVPEASDREAAAAVALADAFLDATLAPPADLAEAPDLDPHGLLEHAIAFAPTVHIGNAVVPVYLMEEADEAFRFQGRRAALLGLAGMEFDNPDEAFDELRRIEAEQADNVELGAQLLAPAPPVEAEAAGSSESPQRHSCDTCSRPIFLKGQTKCADCIDKPGACDAGPKSCEGCGCVPCVGAGGECPGKMKAPNAATTPLRDRIIAALDEGAAEFIKCAYSECSGAHGHLASAIERLLAQPDVLALLRVQSEAWA